MKSIYTFILAVALICAWATIGSAELEVTKSTDKKYKVGDKLPDGAILKVSKDKQIQLLKKPENKLHTVYGRYCGTLAKYNERKLTWWERLFGIKPTRRNDIGIGGTRSARVGFEGC